MRKTINMEVKCDVWRWRCKANLSSTYVKSPYTFRITLLLIKICSSYHFYVRFREDNCKQYTFSHWKIRFLFWVIYELTKSSMTCQIVIFMTPRSSPNTLLSVYVLHRKKTYYRNLLPKSYRNSTEVGTITTNRPVEYFVIPASIL